MITVNIKGGLGNQLFQYATARRLADRRQTRLELDLSWFDAPGGDTPRRFLLDQFSIRAHLRHGYARRLLRRMRRARVIDYHEKSFRFDPAVLALPNNTRLHGYFQSPRYFEDIRDQLRADLTLGVRRSPSAARTATAIASSPNPVSLHVRRGDYVSQPVAAAKHGVLDAEYYRRALASIPGPEATVFVFSDDLDWCRAHLGLKDEAVYVSDTESPVEDLVLMASCSHHVIANSTFSWWAAWLDPSPAKTVVAPEWWSADGSLSAVDLIPADWFRR